MKMCIKSLLSLGLVLLVTACHKHTPEIPAVITALQPGMPKGIEVADTIIYQVILSNPNPDDTWTTECLRGLNRKRLVDSIFEMVYDGKITAFNRETHEKLTIKQLRDMEKADGFSRDKIGMIQFTEAWYLDPEKKTMVKNVLAMDIGYNYYTSEGDLVGYKSLFRVEME